MVGRTLVMFALLPAAALAQLTLNLVDPIPNAGGTVQVLVQGVQDITTPVNPKEIPRPTSLYGVRVHFVGDVDAPILSIDRRATAPTPKSRSRFPNEPQAPRP